MNYNETREFLLKLSEFYDMKWVKQGNDKRDYYTRMVMQIVGFNIKVNKITAKYKLGQNRPEDMENVAINLDKLGDEDAKLVAAYIRKEMKK